MVMAACLGSHHPICRSIDLDSGVNSVVGGCHEGAKICSHKCKDMCQAPEGIADAVALQQAAAQEGSAG